MTEQENTDTRSNILAEIVERELAMFLETPNEGGVAACQRRPETFRIMRHMAHCIHDEGFLASYLDDLRAAELSGRNFMLEKYARMDNRLPPLNDSPLLDEIADAENAFLEEAQKLNPDALRGRGVFRNYLRCELETLSPASLELYAREVRLARAQGRNLALERHNWLARKTGREPLKTAKF